MCVPRDQMFRLNLSFTVHLIGTKILAVIYFPRFGGFQSTFYERYCKLKFQPVLESENGSYTCKLP